MRKSIIVLWIFFFAQFFGNFFIMVFAVAKDVNSERKIKIYTSNKSISKLMFNMAEVSATNANLQMSISFFEKEKIKESILEGGKVDIIITDDYELLRELEELKLVNFAKISEIFYDRLVYIKLNSATSNSKTKEELDLGYFSEADKEEKIIFFKTSPEDKDIMDNNANKIPHVFVQSSKLCKRINTLIEVYQNSKEYIILKQSIAQKCEIKYSAFFDDLYNLYYIAIVENGNSALSKKTVEFLKNSKQIKDQIKENGYNKADFSDNNILF